MAVDAFHTQIERTGASVEELVLKLGMRSLSGEISWALLRSERWSNIVRDGDEIRLEGSTEASGLHGRRITIKRPAGEGYITMFLPKTYEVSYIS